MCLRAWVEKLSDDVDLWEDLTSLDFEKWLVEEMRKARGGGHGGEPTS